MVEADAARWITRLPVPLMLVVGALNGSAEVCGPLLGLVVRGSVHQGLLTIAATEGVQSLISDWNSVLGIETITKKTRYEFYF